MLPPDPKKLLPPGAADTTPDQAPFPHEGQPHAEPAAGSGNHPLVQAGAAEHRPPPAALAVPPSLGTLMHAFRRRWRSALALALGGACLAFAVASQVVPGEYPSAIVFRILSRPPQGSLENEENFTNVQKAQVALLKSNEVLSDAIQRSRVAELYGVTLQVAQMKKKLTATFTEGPEIMTVQLGGDNPEVVAAFLNALGEVYPEKVAAGDDARIKSRIVQLRRRMYLDAEKKDPARQPSLSEQLRDKRVELSLAEQKAGLFDVDALARKLNHAVIEQQQSQRDVRDKRLARTAMEAELDSRQKRVDHPPLPVVSDSEAEETIKGEPGYVNLMKDIADAQKKIDTLKRLAKGEEGRKQLANARDQMDVQENKRTALIEKAKTVYVRKLQRQLVEQDRRAIIELRDKIDQTKKQEIALDAEVRRWAAEAELFRNGGPKVPPEVEALRDQVKQLEKELSKVGDELAALEGALPLNPRVTRLTEAFVPTEKDYTKTLKVSAAASVGIFGLLLLGVCFLEARGRRLSTAEDLTSLGIRVVGTLPRLPPANRKLASGSLGGLDVQLGMTEAVDAIRTVLLHAPRIDGARVVMVTSAIGGEGKTTLASHLAASLARAWRKTLLIDGDLRNPAQHLQLDLPLEPGLSEALRTEVEFEDTIKPTTLSRLWLMPAGKVDAHSLQALAQDGVSNVFERLKGQYDFIVLDTSPVLPVPDALLLGQQADAVVLAVMRDVSRIPAVYSAQQRLESLGIRILGAVVIGEKMEVYGHRVPYPRQGG